MGARRISSASITVATEAAPVAEAAETCGSISNKMLDGDRGGDGIRRRSTVSKVIGYLWCVEASLIRSLTASSNFGVEVVLYAVTQTT